MPVASIVAFWGVALLLIIVPGADWAFTISAGLRGRSVVPAVGGLVLGYAGMTVVVAAGVGAVVAHNPDALTALTVLGGGYLMWHGVRTVISPTSPITTMTVDTAAEGRPHDELDDARRRRRSQRAQPQGPADLRRPAPTVHQP
jgi:threonine/homoserine/homoserine lactone efflux protein